MKAESTTFFCHHSGCGQKVTPEVYGDGLDGPDPVALTLALVSLGWHVLPRNLYMEETHGCPSHPFGGEKAPTGAPKTDPGTKVP